MLSSCMPPSLRRLDPIDNVPGEIRASLHRFVVGAADVDGGRAVARDVDFYPTCLPVQAALLSVELSFSLTLALAFHLAFSFSFTLCFRVALALALSFSFALPLTLGVELALALALRERRRTHTEGDAERGDRSCERERAAAGDTVLIGGVPIVHFRLLVSSQSLDRPWLSSPVWDRICRRLRATPAIEQAGLKAASAASPRCRDAGSAARRHARLLGAARSATGWSQVSRSPKGWAQDRRRSGPRR